MSIASDLIDDARSYAAGTLAQATSQLGLAISEADNLGRSISTGNPFPKININPPQPGDPGTVPQYAGPHYKDPGFTVQDPVLSNVPNLVLPTDPGAIPSLLPFNQPRQPTDDPGSVPGDVPNLNALPAIPDVPDLISEIKGLERPVLTPLTMPTAPNYVAPEFLGVRPTTPGAPPTNLDKKLLAQYNTMSPIIRDVLNNELDSFIDREFPNFRPGMAAIEARLAKYLAGGSALTPEIENAIYNRTLDKTNMDGKRARDKAWGEAARAGFTVPSALLLSQVQDIEQERRNNNARAATDIAIRQAELEQNNLQFAVSQSANLRSIALNAGLAFYMSLVQINGQALTFARDTVEQIAKVYDLSIRYSEIQTRIYEADAAVYRARLEGALAAIQVYEAQIRALQAEAEVDIARVNAFRALVDAVTAEANVYRSEIEAITARATIEKLKVDIYQARVGAYAASVNAYTAKWQGYEAAVRGEAAKVQASAEPVRAYAAKTQAYEATVRARAIEIDSYVKTNEAKIHQFTAQLEAYRTKVMGLSESVKAEVMSYDTTIKAFVAKANAIAERSRADIASYDAALHAIVSTAQIYMEQLRETHRIDIERVHAVAQIATGGANVYGGVAQAALSGMNTLAAEVASESA